MPEGEISGLKLGQDTKFIERETCDEDAPHLITYVETKPATTKDHEVTENVHQTLAEKELLPDKHLVDAGYIDAQLLVDSKNHYEVDLIGPAPGDSQWQSRAGKGFGLANFEIDWEQERVRCPQGKFSSTLYKSDKLGKISMYYLEKFLPHPCITWRGR